MILFWLVAALMTVAAVVFSLYPIVRRHRYVVEADHHTVVYTDQLDEIDRDEARGLLTKAEANAGRDEINQRLAETMAKAGQPSSLGSTKYRLASVIGVALLLPGGAIGFYGYLGSPEFPDMPFATRTLPQPTQTAQRGQGGQGAGQAQANMPDMATLTQRLIDRLKTDPNNLDGWLLLGRTHLQAQNVTGAVDAFVKARELAPKRADIAAAHGELMVIRDQGQISEAARKAFNEARAMNPNEARALFYLGLDSSQQGKYQDALQYWVDLQAISPPDAPFVSQLKAYIDEATQKSGIDIASIKPRLKPVEPAETAPQRGPSREDVEAARDMAPADRREMIRGMVERLAERLEENPNDVVGWERLSNAYRVLGEPEKARQALERAKAVQIPSAPPAAAPPTAAAPSGPTREDIDAARQMSPGDRQEMIRGMVEGLADRLKENPNDRAGWLRLANAYRVLGETAKSREAMEKAQALGGAAPK